MPSGLSFLVNLMPLAVSLCEFHQNISPCAATLVVDMEPGTGFRTLAVHYSCWQALKVLNLVQTTIGEFYIMVDAWYLFS